MGICGILFGIFHCIDFEIIAFEGKKTMFFKTLPGKVSSL
jgi:hypothetical protein